MIRRILGYLIILMIITSISICSGKTSFLNQNKKISVPGDSLFCKRVKILSENYFELALKALNDSLENRIKCYDFDYVKVIFNPEKNLLGLLPRDYDNLGLDYYLKGYTKLEKGSSINKDFAIFYINDILFQVDEATLKQIDVKFLVIDLVYLLDSSNFKTKKKGCFLKRGNPYLTLRSFLSFNIAGDTIEVNKFGVKNDTAINVTWQDL